MGPPDRACLIPSNQMFNPSRHVSPQGIESLAATTAESIGLELPPANFFEIASRYLNCEINISKNEIKVKAFKKYLRWTKFIARVEAEGRSSLSHYNHAVSSLFRTLSVSSVHFLCKRDTAFAAPVEVDAAPLASSNL
ncbi:hypothetical protein K1719_031167 [Acacia pycnantha]|nr:hypothetical protein K1719_031167 [Acacia pycnantha]